MKRRPRIVNPRAARSVITASSGTSHGSMYQAFVVLQFVGETDQQCVPIRAERRVVVTAAAAEPDAGIVECDERHQHHVENRPWALARPTRYRVRECRNGFGRCGVSDAYR